jgi:hypothetical protein
MIMRTIFVAAAALASVSFSPGHAVGAAASWCAVIDRGTGSVYWDCQYSSFDDDPINRAAQAETHCPKY